MNSNIYTIHCSIIRGHYITGVYLRFDSSSYNLQYAYAGHHNIYLIRQGELTALDGKGTPLILMKDFVTTSYTIPIEKEIGYFYFQMGFMKYLTQRMNFME